VRRLAMTTTTTIHLEISDVEQVTPTTRRTPTGARGVSRYSDADNDLSRELEEVAVRRLQDPGELVDARTVLPELSD
jgi:hypothetical protein